MLGRKKKQEEQASTETDYDKPQTLAELDAMAREKKDDKVMLNDGDGESSPESLEHEVTHNDEHTVDTNVKQVTGSQRRLQGLVVIAGFALVVATVLFYTQIEDGEGIGIGAGGSSVVVEPGEEDPEILPRGTFAYVAKSGASNYTRVNLEDKAEESIDIGATIPSSGGGSPVFQLSSNSLVSAVQSSSGITVKNQEETTTVLGDKISSVSQWLLIPDGTRIYALVGADLYSVDTKSGNESVIAESFVPAGSQVSRLNYGRDGTIHLYTKTEGLLRGSVLNLTSLEVESIEKEVIRLERMSGFSNTSLSPDGVAILFRYNSNGNETLQLLSLNSFVLRTIYVAEAGNAPTQFVWSEDSNNVLVYESGAAPRLANLKVGTLEKEILLENAGSATNLSWSTGKKQASFVSGSTLKSIDIESKEVTDLLGSVSAGDITGWFQN